MALRPNVPLLGDFALEQVGLRAIGRDARHIADRLGRDDRQVAFVGPGQRGQEPQASRTLRDRRKSAASRPPAAMPSMTSWRNCSIGNSGQSARGKAWPLWTIRERSVDISWLPTRRPPGAADQ